LNTTYPDYVVVNPENSTISAASWIVRST
jgi:hypothetical protein